MDYNVIKCSINQNPIFFKQCNEPDKQNLMNIIEPTDHANAFCCSIQNTCNSVTDVHEYVLHSKKINLGLCRMGCDTMLGQGCTGVTAPLQAMGQH